MEKGGEEERGRRKEAGGERGGCNEMHCWEEAGRGSHDPCDVVGILMSHKVPRRKIQSAHGSVVGKHIHNTLRCVCTNTHVHV